MRELSLASPKTELNELKGAGKYDSKLVKLEPGKMYYFSSYAISEGKLYVSFVDSFYTYLPSLPIILYTKAKQISELEFSFKSKITHLGYGADSIKSFGHCYAENELPTFNDKKTNLGISTDTLTFFSSIKFENGLSYYIRAYAKNSNGICYGEQIEIKTINYSPEISVFVDNSKITGESAEFNVSINNIQNLEIFERGILVAIDTTWDNFSFSQRLVSNIDSDNFTIKKEFMWALTKYYYKAYVSTNLGYFYSKIDLLETKSPGPVTLVDYMIKVTGTSSVDVMVGYSAHGGSSISELGMCYSKLSAPTILDEKIYGSGGMMEYEYSIDDLDPGQKYYFRQFAISDAGLFYGKEIELTIS